MFTAVTTSYGGVTWSEVAKLTTPEGAANVRFGNAVSTYCNAIVVGASADDTSVTGGYKKGELIGLYDCFVLSVLLAARCCRSLHVCINGTASEKAASYICLLGSCCQLLRCLLFC